MKSITVSDLRKHMNEVLNRVKFGGERIIIVRHGKPVAVIVPLKDFEVLEKLKNDRNR
jgi:prevent-host-death family protein